MGERIVGRNPVYEVLRVGRRRASRLMVAQGVKEKGRLAEITHICKTRKIPLEYVPRRQLDELGGHSADRDGSWVFSHVVRLSLLLQEGSFGALR